MGRTRAIGRCGSVGGEKGMGFLDAMEWIWDAVMVRCEAGKGIEIRDDKDAAEGGRGWTWVNHTNKE